MDQPVLPYKKLWLEINYLQKRLLFIDILSAHLWKLSCFFIWGYFKTEDNILLILTAAWDTHGVWIAKTNKKSTPNPVRLSMKAMFDMYNLSSKASNINSTGMWIWYNQTFIAFMSREWSRGYPNRRLVL